MRRIMLVVLPLLLIACSGGDSGPWYERDNAKAAYEISQEFVKQQILNAESSVFPSMRWNDKVRIDRDGETQRYTVRAYVDSEDAFGETLRTEYVVDVEMVAEDDWILHDLEFLE